MNYSRLGLAALGGMVAYFAFGFYCSGWCRVLSPRPTSTRHVFRPKEKMMSVMPIGMVATLIAILVVAILFAMLPPGGSGTYARVRASAFSLAFSRSAHLCCTTT